MSTVTPAAVSRGPHTPFAIEQVEIDNPRPDELLVKILATGICHTDLVTKAALSKDIGPVVLGHEGAGIVESVGDEVIGIVPGDHVVLTYRHCGNCERCISGAPAYCLRADTLNGLGVRADGTSILFSGGEPVRSAFFGQSSFAGHAIAHADNSVVVAADLDPAVIAPLGCGFQTGAGAVLNVLRPEQNSSIVVFGAGSVGFAALLAARASGVTNVVAVDPVAGRRALAREFGFDAVDPEAGNVTERVRELTDGGATHALDTTGLAEVVRTALSSLRPRGDLVVVGLGAREMTLNIADVTLAGKSIRGCIEGDSIAAQFIPYLADLYTQGHFPIDRLTTRYNCTDIERAISDQRTGKVIKPVLIW